MASFHLNRSDLDFLLQQVTAGVDYCQLHNSLDPGGVREVSGSHNPAGSSFGASGSHSPIYL